MDYTKFKCEAENSAGTGKAEIEIKDMKQFQEMSKHSELRNENPQPRLESQDESFYYDLYDEDYDETGRVRSPHQVVNSYRDHKNRTFYKLSINKSNRLVKNEDSLQRINGSHECLFYF